jgi:hypothetical protein
VNHIKKVAGFLQVALGKKKVRFQRIAMGIEEVADAIVKKENGVYPQPEHGQDDGQKEISSGGDARHHQKYKIQKGSAEKRKKKLRREENTKKHHGDDTCQHASMKCVMTM